MMGRGSLGRLRRILYNCLPLPGCALHPLGRDRTRASLALRDPPSRTSHTPPSPAILSSSAHPLETPLRKCSRTLIAIRLSRRGSIIVGANASTISQPALLPVFPTLNAPNLTFMARRFENYIRKYKYKSSKLIASSKFTYSREVK